MATVFRIHGDNIVECERIIALIIQETNPTNVSSNLFSPSTIVYDLDFSYLGSDYTWHFELLPGFNKAGRSRWAGNIFDALKDNGSFLDETPDAIITKVDANNDESILLAIEFCSALQAGNQAWQRSGRAFSTGRTGCPYIYIVEFVKYELDSSTRKRKALRFPNAAVPYSYVSFSQANSSFVAQVYVRSEEFDKIADTSLRTFNENDFAEKELSVYIVKLLAGIDTSAEESAIIQKNLNVVMFLSSSANAATNFTPAQWKRIAAYTNGIVDYSVKNANFNFHKIITAKGHHGKSESVLSLIDTYSKGLASKDLPFGIIPAALRSAFAQKLGMLYPSYDQTVLNKIGNTSSDLILCLIKGFKPGGDDNRPDRGILPLISMLDTANCEIMTYLYGPILDRNFDLLTNHPKQLANANGLWKSILSLSNFLALDVPIIARPSRDEELLLDTTSLKQYYTNASASNSLVKKAFSSIPRSYHEDDVDTGLHYTFTHKMSQVCFEGMCNPPGGDWSGFSILENGKERRWLSLPRVSGDIAGKRPDHVIELFNIFDKPLLLSIESKENSYDLEPNVGHGLINYIKYLMSYVPNVERVTNGSSADWTRASSKSSDTDFEIVSAAAYLKNTAQDNNTVFLNSKCEMLFILNPTSSGWDIEIATSSAKTNTIKEYIKRMVNVSATNDINIH